MTALEYQRYHSFPPARGGSDIVAPFLSSASDVQPMEMIFLPAASADATKTIPDFLHYRFIPYDHANLPIRIEQLAPYRAVVDNPGSGWLETHRLFVEGYRALVNGHVVAVAMSADARVLVPVPAGRSTVQLDYVGTPLLRFGYVAMTIGWLGFACWSLARWRPTGSARLLGNA
jgi:hypothetical protein